MRHFTTSKPRHFTAFRSPPRRLPTPPRGTNGRTKAVICTPRAAISFRPVTQPNPTRLFSTTRTARTPSRRARRSEKARQSSGGTRQRRPKQILARTKRLVPCDPWLRQARQHDAATLRRTRGLGSLEQHPPLRRAARKIARASGASRWFADRPPGMPVSGTCRPRNEVSERRTSERRPTLLRESHTRHKLWRPGIERTSRQDAYRSAFRSTRAPMRYVSVRFG